VGRKPTQIAGSHRSGAGTRLPPATGRRPSHRGVEGFHDERRKRHSRADHAQGP
jgi:hypothetical protein